MLYQKKGHIFFFTQFLDIIYEFSSLESASYTPSASIPDLWKRIFELEKGYPASLEKAETVPGVRPW